jgi:hypothetical protein
MTKQGESTTKKPGEGLMWVGGVVAVIGLLLGATAVAGGSAPGLLTIGVVIAGALLAVVGFSRRLLAAVERN